MKKNSYFKQCQTNLATATKETNNLINNTRTNIKAPKLEILNKLI